MQVGLWASSLEDVSCGPFATLEARVRVVHRSLVVVVPVKREAVWVPAVYWLTGHLHEE